MTASPLVGRLLELYQTRPRAAIFMSGGGSNARVLLGHDGVRKHYEVAAVFTDNPESNARVIADDYGVEYGCIVPEVRGAAGRTAYFDRVRDWLDGLKVEAIFYAGFMRIVSSQITQHYPGVNVHPGDLTVLDDEGVPIYTGQLLAVVTRMADEAGYLASAVHVVDEGVDTGQVLALTPKLWVKETGTDDYMEMHRQLQKHEYKLFPETLVRLGQGVQEHELPLRG